LASPSALLLSIHSQYADKIFEGTKTVELRRVRPRHIEKGGVVFIYVPSPIRSLVGAFKVDQIVEMPLRKLWEAVQGRAGISRRDFDAYYEGASMGVAIFFTEVWNLPKPIDLRELQDNLKISPPQSFRYITVTKLGGEHFRSQFSMLGCTINSPGLQAGG